MKTDTKQSLNGPGSNERTFYNELVVLIRNVPRYRGQDILYYSHKLHDCKPDRGIEILRTGSQSVSGNEGLAAMLEKQLI